MPWDVNTRRRILRRVFVETPGWEKQTTDIINNTMKRKGFKKKYAGRESGKGGKEFG